MEQQWIHTPQGNWLYAVDSYCGVVADVGSSWAARIEDNTTVYPANVTFLSREEAQAWVEQHLTALLANAKAQE
jgi:hypothetical protein